MQLVVDDGRTPVAVGDAAGSGTRTDRRTAPGAVGAKLPSLDGLRALAVGMVLVAHTQLGTLVPGAAGVWFRATFHGHLGSATFFGLSGLLITHRLLGEHARYGRIGIGSFYARRVLRIYPSMLALIATVALAWRVGRLPAMSWHDLAVATLGLWNYAPTTSGWTLGHLWSIGFEQDFYWTWPPVFAWLLSRRIGAGRPAAIRVILVAVALSPLIRVATVLYMPALKGQVGLMLHTRLGAPLFGALAAILMRDQRWSGWYAAVRARHASLLAGLVLAVANPLGTALFQGRYQYTVGYTLEAASIAWLLVWMIMEPASWLGRALNSRTATALGRRSYAIFLFQQLVTGDQPLVPGPWWLRLAALAVVVEVVHRGLELPASRLAGRIGRLAPPVEIVAPPLVRAA